MNDRTGQVDRCIEVVTENQDFQRERGRTNTEWRNARHAHGMDWNCSDRNELVMSRVCTYVSVIMCTYVCVYTVHLCHTHLFPHSVC